MNRPRPVPHKHSTPNGDITIWGDPAKVKEFFPDLTPTSKTDPVPRTISVPARNRRQYPGDGSPIRQGGHQRKVLSGGYASTRATPGRPFTCEWTTGTGSTKKTHVYTFTLQGPFRAVRIMAMEEAATGGGKPKWVLRSPNGKGYPMEHVAPGGLNLNVHVTP